MRGEWDTEGTESWSKPTKGTPSSGGRVMQAPTYEGSYGLRGALMMRNAAKKDASYGYTLRSLEKKFIPARISDPLSIRANLYDEMGMEDPTSAIGMAQDLYMKMYRKRD